MSVSRGRGRRNETNSSSNRKSSHLVSAGSRRGEEKQIIDDVTHQMESLSTQNRHSSSIHELSMNFFRDVEVYSKMEDALQVSRIGNHYCSVQIFYIPPDFSLDEIEGKKNENCGVYPLDETNLQAAEIRRKEWPMELVMVAAESMRVTAAGGKPEKGELAKAAAVREVSEELGVSIDESSVWYGYSTVHRKTHHAGHFYYAVTRNKTTFDAMVQSPLPKDNEWNEAVVKLARTYNWSRRRKRNSEFEDYGLPSSLSNVNSRMSVLANCYVLRLMSKQIVSDLFQASLDKQFRVRSRESDQLRFEEALFEVYFGENGLSRRMNEAQLKVEIQLKNKTQPIAQIEKGSDAIQQ